ncbi:hypothetical protein OROHE_013015 [Orobanche hederae]
MAEILDVKHASGRTALKFDGGGERRPAITTSGGLVIKVGLGTCILETSNAGYG